MTYSAGPTSGTVVDADTQQPIRGVLVIALWDLEGGMERSIVGTFRFSEAVTDESGQYRMPGWGPIPRPREGVLDAYDPQLLIFKPGYATVRLLNDPGAQPYKRFALEIHDSVFNGKTTALHKYQGTLRDYSKDVGFIVRRLYDVLNNGPECRWKQIPKAVRILEAERKREDDAGVIPIYTISAKLLTARKECAPVDEFMKTYQESN